MKKELTSLVIRSQAGDKAALNELISAVYNDIYYFALKTVKKEEIAADITQESCIEIITTIEKLREPSSFLGWARKIVYHRCTKHFKPSREVLVEEDEEETTIFDTLVDESAEAQVAQCLEDKEFRETLMSLIQSLPSEQSSALLMYYYEDLSVGEIAEIQNTSEGTVKSRLNYARKAIRKKVEAYEEKTGTKLHGILPFPLLLQKLFGKGFLDLPKLSVPAFAQLAGATGAATATTVTASAVSAAKAGVSALVIKIAAGAAAVAVAVGGFVGVSHLVADQDESTDETVKQSDETSETDLNGEEDLSHDVSFGEESESQKPFTLADAYGEWCNGLDTYGKLAFVEPVFVIYEDGTFSWDGYLHQWTVSPEKEGYLELFDVTLNEEYLGALGGNGLDERQRVQIAFYIDPRKNIPCAEIYLLPISESDMGRVMSYGYREQDIMEIESVTEDTLVKILPVVGKLDWYRFQVFVYQYKDMTTEDGNGIDRSVYSGVIWKLEPGYYYEIYVIDQRWDTEYIGHTERFYVEGHQMSVYVAVTEGEDISMPEQWLVYGIDRQTHEGIKVIVDNGYYH